MADLDRQRIEHFRQRWAHDHFRNSDSPVPDPGQQQTQNSSARKTPDRDLELSEINASQPTSRSSSRFKKFQQRSWRENLGLSSNNRLAVMNAPKPASDDEDPTNSSSEVVNTFTDEETRTDGAASRTPQPQPSKPASESNDRPAWLTELYTLAWLTFFALWGTLARLGVEAITQYPDAPVTSRVLWANLGGSFVMGFLVEDRGLFGIPDQLQSSLKKDGRDIMDEGKIRSTHLKHKKTIPLYIGLSTGFCGSFTSFSSFIRDAFLALTNDLPSSSPTTPYQSAGSPYHRNGGFSFLALLCILIIHPAISLAALKTGGHFAILIRPLLRRRLFLPKVLTILDPLMAFVGFGCWIGSLFLTIFPPSSGPSPINWRARATIPLIFAPPGCILRYYLAKWMNKPSTPNFPLGTFVANVFGTLVLGMAWDLAHARSIGASLTGGNACAVLLGVQEGFCGCLTTVSTWVLEINGLGRKWGWLYGSISVAVSLAGMIIVMGSMGWTIGFAEPVCG